MRQIGHMGRSPMRERASANPSYSGKSLQSKIFHCAELIGFARTSVLALKQGRLAVGCSLFAHASQEARSICLGRSEPRLPSRLCGKTTLAVLEISQTLADGARKCARAEQRARLCDSWKILQSTSSGSAAAKPPISQRSTFSKTGVKRPALPRGAGAA